MTKAQDFEAETKSRGEELAALAKAKEIIIEATGGAASFVQVSATVRSTGIEAVKIVRNLAREHRSQALAVGLANVDETASWLRCRRLCEGEGSDR